MAIISTDDKRLKELLKQAMLELFEERRDLFSEIIAEAIEEAGLINAIREGQASYKVDEKEVLDTLGE